MMQFAILDSFWTTSVPHSRSVALYNVAAISEGFFQKPTTYKRPSHVDNRFLKLTLTQMPHPMQSSSEIHAILAVGVASTHNFPDMTINI